MARTLARSYMLVAKNSAQMLAPSMTARTTVTTPTEKVQKQALKTERPDLTAGCYDRLAAQRRR